MPEPQRIAKLLARAGIASRRDIERMIEEGRIAIDGKTVDKPATLLASLKGVTVDGQPVSAPEPARLFLYHKPPGLLTAARDPQGRPTIYDRLPKGLPRVMPVGRLDMNTEGLLLLTTDGELKRQLELPASGVERTYRARAFGGVSQEQLEALIEGVEIEGVRYGPIDANLERSIGRNQWIELKLTEGKNREVRRVLEHLGLQVSRLIRTAYGPFALADLPAGMVDEVRRHDVIIFRKELDRKSPRPKGDVIDEAPPERTDGRERPAGFRERAKPMGRPAPASRPAPPRTGSARPPKAVDEVRRPDRKPPAGKSPRRRDDKADDKPHFITNRQKRSADFRERVKSDGWSEAAARPAATSAPRTGGARPAAKVDEGRRPDRKQPPKNAPRNRERRPGEDRPRPSSAPPGARRPGRPSPSRGKPRK